MTDKVQEALEIINNCRFAIEDGAPYVNIDETDIDTLYKALQQDQVTEEVKQLHKLRRDMQSRIESLEGRLAGYADHNKASKMVDVELLKRGIVYPKDYKQASSIEDALETNLYNAGYDQAIDDLKEAGYLNAPEVKVISLTCTCGNTIRVEVQPPKGEE